MDYRFADYRAHVHDATAEYQPENRANSTVTISLIIKNIRVFQISHALRVCNVIRLCSVKVRGLNAVTQLE